MTRPPTWDERMGPRPPDPEPRLELVRLFWRALGPSNRPLECALYRTDAGLEVRAGYGELDLVHSQHVADESEGAALATKWLAAIHAKGGFIDLPIGDDAAQ